MDRERPAAAAPVNGIVVAGDSAGGALAASCRGAHRRAMVIYPSLDMIASGGSIDAFADGPVLTREMMEMFRAAYFPVLPDRETPSASPLRAPSFAGLPRAHLRQRIRSAADQARAYAARLAEAGVSVRYREAAGHVHGALTPRRAVPSGRADLAGCIDDLASLFKEEQRRQTLKR